MNNIKAIFEVYKRVLYILTPQQKKKSVLVFLSMILMSILELLGVSAIYPFLQTMVLGDELKNKWYSRWLYIFMPGISAREVILVFGGTIIVVFIIKNALAILCTYLQSRFAADFQRDTSTMMLETYLKRPYEFFVNINSSIILRGVSGDVSAVYQILLCFFQIIAEMITILLLAFFLFVVDWIIAVSSFLVAAMCFLLIIFGFKNKIKSAGIEFRESDAKQRKSAYQTISGIKEIMVMGRKESFISEFRDASDNLAHAVLVNSVISACPDRILEGICISGFIGIMCIRIAMGVDYSEFIPLLGSFAMGAFKILPSVSKVSNRINTIIYNQFGLKECYDNIKWAREVEKHNSRDDKNGNFEFMTKNDHCLEKKTFDDSITVREIEWKYTNSKSSILDGLSLCILKGEAVALIGSSGAGKTTLADIILGLLKPQKGTVEIDGTDIFAAPDEWHRMISYVPQMVFLLDDTIRANVAFGIPKEQVSDDRIWDALEEAQLKSFVDSLPNKLDTIVGERGIKFSGGQRQRIALARALYENPSILILDEATSALDNETEEAVMESIDALHGQKTLIIIAHRLSTIRNCDRIIEIVEGVAVERNKEEVLADVIN